MKVEVFPLPSGERGRVRGNGRNGKSVSRQVLRDRQNYAEIGLRRTHPKNSPFGKGG